MFEQYQPGFKVKVLHFISIIMPCHQKKKSVAAVFVDLQQAYDHVWRAGLMYKMQKIEIQGNIYHWIKSFLQNRTIVTKVNNTLSPKKC